MANEGSDQYEDLNVWLTEGPDYHLQCVAIRRLLFRQEQADHELKAHMDVVGVEAERTTGAANDRAVDE